MCDICHEGGQVLGPFLKPMTHLVHTEYLLAGRTRSDVRDVLRDTMFAATVTGAPVENACRLIREYESEGRGYYAGALALIGRDEDGAPDRGLADRDPHRRRQSRRRDAGDRRRDPGARLRARPRGGRDAGQGRRHPLGVRPGPRGARCARRRRRPRPGRGRADRAELAQPAAREVLADRPGRRAARAVAGRQDDRDPARRGRLREHARPRVLGARHGLAGDPPRGGARGRSRGPVRRRRPRRGRPRPRRPARPRHIPKIAAYRAGDRRAARLREALPGGVSGPPGPVRPARHPAGLQGHRLPGHPVLGRDRRPRGAGRLLQHLRRSPRARKGFPDGVRVEADPATGDVHLVAGPNYRGVQFHAESILTENGFALLRQLLLELLG